MRVNVTKTEPLGNVVGPAVSIATKMDVFITTSEAKDLLAKNAALGEWLKPVAGGFELRAESATLRELGFADLDARIEAEASRQAARR